MAHDTGDGPRKPTRRRVRAAKPGGTANTFAPGAAAPGAFFVSGAANEGMASGMGRDFEMEEL